jgi:hypothetical protein
MDWRDCIFITKDSKSFVWTTRDKLFITQAALTYTEAENKAKKNNEKFVCGKFFPFVGDSDHNHHQNIDPSCFSVSLSIKNEALDFSHEVLNVDPFTLRIRNVIDYSIGLPHGFMIRDHFYKFDMKYFDKLLVEKEHYEYVMINDSESFTWINENNGFKIQFCLKLIKDKFYKLYNCKDIKIPVA